MNTALPWLDLSKTLFFKPTVRGECPEHGEADLFELNLGGATCLLTCVQCWNVEQKRIFDACVVENVKMEFIKREEQP